MHFIVLSSSRGTTFQAVLDRINDGSLHATCLGLVSDREDRGCVEKAKQAGLPVKIVERKKDEPREEYDKRLFDAIGEFESSLPSPANGGGAGGGGLIAALGWMYLFSPWFVKKFHNRIVNVHPSLLPKYPGIHSLQEALDAGDKETGMTIHLIDDGIDTGKILLQKQCPILPGDTLDTLKARVQELEKEWYPRVLEMIERGEMKL